MSKRLPRWMTFWAAALLVATIGQGAEEEPIYSGPQAGEELKPFTVQGVYDDEAGQELDFVTKADGKPLLLIFVHQVTRPSVGLARALSKYAHGREEDGLHASIVWLAEDKSEAEAYLKRARRSLGFSSSVGIFPDGSEGPGEYGLNRKVSLTILVANENKVTANFALVQPALTDAPGILEEVVKLVGGKVPTLEELQKDGAGKRGR